MAVEVSAVQMDIWLAHCCFAGVRKNG